MKVAVVQASWTPHSEARLKAAESYLSAGGDALVVITVAAAQSDYEWPVPAPENTALFTDMDYWRISYWKLRQRLLPALEASDPDVVVITGWAFKESFCALGWAMKRSKPRVVVSDSQRIDQGRNLIIERVKRRLVRNFDAALVGGTPHIDYAVSLGFDASACFVGCDVVDNDFFRLPRATPGSGPPMLLSCIRLLARKNVPAVLDVLAQNDSWRWRIAGDGPERERIEQQITSHGLRDRVELLGHVPYEALPKLYSSADIYLQPSLSEPWGLAVNEAMAAGLPVLVSDRCGCAADLVRRENGITFAASEPASLKSALALLEEKRGLWPEMGRASQQRISSWGLDLFATNLRNSCESAVARAGQGPRPGKMWGHLL